MFANQADKTTAIANANAALEAAKQADATASTPETVKAVEDATAALATAEATEVTPAAPASPTVDKKSAYAGSSLRVAAAKHNSWGAGIPRGTYSDCKDASGRLETFGFQVDGEGNLNFGKDGFPKPQTNATTGLPVATGRFIENNETGGRYKLYNSMLNGLTADQRIALTDTDAEAVVFEETEMEIKVETTEGRSSFKFEIA